MTLYKRYTSEDGTKVSLFIAKDNLNLNKRFVYELSYDVYSLNELIQETRRNCGVPKKYFYVIVSDTKPTMEYFHITMNITGEGHTLDGKNRNCYQLEGYQYSVCELNQALMDVRDLDEDNEQYRGDRLLDGISRIEGLIDFIHGSKEYESVESIQKENNEKINKAVDKLLDIGFKEVADILNSNVDKADDIVGEVNKIHELLSVNAELAASRKLLDQNCYLALVRSTIKIKVINSMDLDLYQKAQDIMNLKPRKYNSNKKQEKN